MALQKFGVIEDSCAAKEVRDILFSLPIKPCYFNPKYYSPMTNCPWINAGNFSNPRNSCDQASLSSARSASRRYEAR